MNWIEFLIILILAGILGWMTQVLFRKKAGGFLVCMVLGFVGGALGTFLSRWFNLPPLIWLGTKWTSVEFPILWCIAGTVIVMGMVAWINKSREE